MGIALFLATGFVLAKAVGKRFELDWLACIALGLGLSAVVPAAILAFLNIALGVQFNAFLVYGVFLALLAIGLLEWLEPGFLREPRLQAFSKRF